MTAVSGAGAWIEKHLWAILAVAMGLYGGYLTGQATTEMRLDAAVRENERLGKRIDALEGMLRIKLGGRFNFMNDAATQINFLCQDNPNCRATFKPVRVPE